LAGRAVLALIAHMTLALPVNWTGERYDWPIVVG